MKRKRLLVALTIAAFLAGFAATVWLRPAVSPEKQRVNTSPLPQSSAPFSNAPATSQNQPRAKTTPAKSLPLSAQIDAILAALQTGADPREQLDALKAALRDVDPKQAIAAILNFLASGRDASTGLAFQVGEGGALDGAPTLRVFLMDQLGQLARDSGDAAGGNIARQVLQTKNSADEWAISLRNLAWSDPNARPFLAGKMREMLTYQPWLQKPDSGFLEAFDVIAYTQDPGFTEPLADMLRTGNPPLQRAAAVALDRLAETAPLAVMNYLNNNPGVLADKPFVRADYFAKADFSDSSQRKAVEAYLDRGDVSVPEKSKLISELASPGSFVSDGLLTSSAPPEPTEKQNSALLDTVQHWIDSQKYPHLQTPLLELQQELAH